MYITDIVNKMTEEQLNEMIEDYEKDANEN